MPQRGQVGEKENGDGVHRATVCVSEVKGTP